MTIVNAAMMMIDSASNSDVDIAYHSKIDVDYDEVIIMSDHIEFLTSENDNQELILLSRLTLMEIPDIISEMSSSISLTFSDFIQSQPVSRNKT
jgi:hypothetical protein